MPTALIVADDPVTGRALRDLVTSANYDCELVSTLDDSRARLRDLDPDLLVIDFALPDGSGIEVLVDVHPAQHCHVLMTSHDPSVQGAIKRLSLDRVEFMRKPIQPKLLMEMLDRLRLANRKSGPKRAKLPGRILGNSKGIRQVRHLIERVAKTDFAVLIEGESGTGKELVANAIHKQSRRAKQNLVAINCGALPASLIDSELFGHERNAFTGASHKHLGVFEQAEGGTLFLDEIGEMPPEFQVRLLRTLETGMIRRLGGSRDIPVDVRVIAATNRKISAAIKDGTLREDLVHRLAMFSLALPPLRDRAEDIPEIAASLLKEAIELSGLDKQMRPEALQKLCSYSWPGNVRQLRNAILHSFVLADKHIYAKYLPDLDAPRAEVAADDGDMETGGLVGSTIAHVEQQLIESTLRRLSGDKPRAAQMLGISLRTLYNRVRAYEAHPRRRGGQQGSESSEY